MELALKRKICLPLGQECRSGAIPPGFEAQISHYRVQLEICSSLSVACVGLSMCKLQLLNSIFSQVIGREKRVRMREALRNMSGPE